MKNLEEQSGFFSYLLKSELRFLQERNLGFDLYNSGYCGLLVFVLVIITLTVFFLAIFNVIPLRRHVTILLPGSGCLALAIGLLGSWLNFRQLDEVSATLFSKAGGAAPLGPGQQAAILAIPLATGLLAMAISLAGYLYLLVFWASALLKTKAGAKEPKKTKASVRKPAKK